ncbi:MAG: DUF2516 family protein [Propionibacteriales bacterium]|nr:DUF2516 family protein [Propionibacteriales bacterium]
MFFYSLQANLASLVYLVLFGVKMWALVDAILRTAPAYVAADKLTKPAWLWILGLTVASHVLLANLTVSLIGTVAAFVYLLDVKPALVAVTRRR